MTKLSVCITTQNEGPRVRATAEAFLAAYPDVEIVIGDDASDDGCCKKLPPECVVSRSEQRVGCGRTKYRLGKVATGDVLTFIDAHQNVMQGDFTKVVELAAEQDVVVQPVIGSITYDQRWRPIELSKSMFYPNPVGLAGLKSHYHATTVVGPEAENFFIGNIGVGLTMSRKTYDRLGGWNRYRGFFGSQERGMALRALATGTDIICMPSVVIGHEFGGKQNPTRQHFPYKAMYNGNPEMNLFHAFYVIADDREWQLYFYNALNEPQRIESDDLARSDREAFAPLRTIPSEVLIPFLEGMWRHVPPLPDKGGATLEPSALRVIAGTSKGRVLELGTGSTIGTEAIRLLGSEIVTIDNGQRFYNAAMKKYARFSKITPLYAPLRNGTYAFPPDLGKFDTIIIDGPPGTQARKATFDALDPYMHDKTQIIIDDAKRDREVIDAFAVKYGLKAEYLNTNRGVALITRDQSIRSMPPLTEQVTNLAAAVGRAVTKLVKLGKVIAPAEVREERMEICKQCEYIRGSRCSKCGCGLIAKLALATEACPDKLWGKV